jgi:hypothetical protein
MGSVSSLTGGSQNTRSYYILSTGRTRLCNEVVKDRENRPDPPKIPSLYAVRPTLPLPIGDDSASWHIL